jgi:ADP-ribosyl-[dinitrogen reductase] hydrolase
LNAKGEEGVLVEAAIGDAYGAAFEYADPTAERPSDLSDYYAHPRHAIGRGRYTDDTEMSTAVAEAMLAGPLSDESLAQWFVAAFKREERTGYAGSFYRFLKTVGSGADFLKRIQPQSEKSGAAMRGWVTGLYRTAGIVMEMAELQAKLTHDTAGGIASAKAAALMTHYFAYRLGPLEQVAEFVSDHVPGPWSRRRTEPVGSKGMDSVHAAIQAVVTHNRLSAILKQCIGFGGDVDTVATIALGAASLSINIAQDLPTHLYDKLEDGEWGKSYLIALDDRLKQRFLLRA